MTKKPKRTVPELRSGKIAFHGGLTADKELFSLEAVLTRHAGAVRLRPLTEAQHAAIAQAEPRKRGKVISSVMETLDAADPAMNSPLEPKDARKD